MSERCVSALILFAAAMLLIGVCSLAAAPTGDVAGGGTVRAARVRTGGGVGSIGGGSVGSRMRRFPLLLADQGGFGLDDDDDAAMFDMNKRQMSDDYGHMRFGKRGENDFAEYGHMRFGRAANV